MVLAEVTKDGEQWQSEPIEEFFRERGIQWDFEITAGIPETLPRLLKTMAGIIHHSLDSFRSHSHAER